VVFTSLASIPKEIGKVICVVVGHKKMLSYQMGLSYTIGCQLTNTGHVARTKEAMKVLNGYGMDYGPHGSVPLGGGEGVVLLLIIQRSFMHSL
jgi:hypothetical protein